MAIETRISNEAYERLALAEPDVKWELWDEVRREKPAMTDAHDWLSTKVDYFLLSQIDWSQYQVRVNSSRVRRPGSAHFIPDVFVLPTAYTAPFRNRSDLLTVFDPPVPLIVEVWSRSTGDYDINEKRAVYQARGDLEIWYFHPYERTLTAWRRLPDGNYEQSLHRNGIVRPVALPDVEIDLAVLFTT
jgi:Uma2 family endonuclease